MSENSPEQTIAATINEQQSLHAEVELAQLALDASHESELRLSAAISEQRKKRAAYLARFDNGSVLPPRSQGPRHG